MTDTRRAEFVEALNYLKLCSVVVGVAEGRRGRAEQTQKRDEEEATERVMSLFDAATAVQGGEPVAWRVFDCSHWNDGKPNQQTLDYWKQQGVTLQYAYAAAPPAARQDEGRDAVAEACEQMAPGWTARRDANAMWTPEEAGKLLANRVMQPHYVEWVIRKCIDSAIRSLKESEAGRVG